MAFSNFCLCIFAVISEQSKEVVTMTIILLLVIHYFDMFDTITCYEFWSHDVNLVSNVANLFPDQDKLMVSGSAMGHIGVWDLEKRSLLSQLTEAHYGPVTGLHCLQNEPIMLTSSTDNSLKVMSNLFNK